MYSKLYGIQVVHIQHSSWPNVYMPPPYNGLQYIIHLKNINEFSLVLAYNRYKLYRRQSEMLLFEKVKLVMILKTIKQNKYISRLDYNVNSPIILITSPPFCWGEWKKCAEKYGQVNCVVNSCELMIYQKQSDKDYHLDSSCS